MNRANLRLYLIAFAFGVVVAQTPIVSAWPMGPISPQGGTVVGATSGGGLCLVGGTIGVCAGTSNGQASCWNGTTWGVCNLYAEPSMRAGWVDEFDFNVGNVSTCAAVGLHFIGAAAGTGASCTITSLSGHPGDLQMVLGTLATGSTRFTSNTSGYTFGGSAGPSCTTSLVRIATLSTAADEFSFRIGFGNFTVAGVDPGDGVFAKYDRAATGDFWVFETCAASSCTSITTSAPVSAGVWNTLKECVSADGSLATFLVNGAATSSQASTIPLESNNRRVALGATALKTVGLNSRVVDVDYIGVDLPFGVAR